MHICIKKERHIALRQCAENPGVFASCGEKSPAARIGRRAEKKGLTLQIAVQAELARAAEPDVPFFTVEARLSDGTVIPTGGVGMTWDEGTDLDEWTIDWAAPVDPEEIAALVFSDGETEIEVPIT